MKPKLIILNGPCGVGKNTIADMYVEEFPKAVVLDIDELRRSVPNYRDNPVESGRTAYELAFAKSKDLLNSGRDVVIPNLIRSGANLDKFASIANELGCEYYEFLLNLSKESAIQRATERGFSPGSLLTPEKLEPMYDSLTQVIATRPQTIKIDASVDASSTFQDLLGHLNLKP